MYCVPSVFLCKHVSCVSESEVNGLVRSTVWRLMDFFWTVCVWISQVIDMFLHCLSKLTTFMHTHSLWHYIFLSSNNIICNLGTTHVHKFPLPNTHHVTDAITINATGHDICNRKLQIYIYFNIRLISTSKCREWKLIIYSHSCLPNSIMSSHHAVLESELAVQTCVKTLSVIGDASSDDCNDVIITNNPKFKYFLKVKKMSVCFLSSSWWNTCFYPQIYSNQVNSSLFSSVCLCVCDRPLCAV